jgi:hypothetical protein
MDKVMEIRLEMLMHTGFNVVPVDEPPTESRGRKKGSPRARNWDIFKWFVMQYPNQWFEFSDERVHTQYDQARKQFDEKCFEITQRYRKIYIRYTPQENESA